MSERLNQAIRFAVDAHTKQIRKLEGIPYIFHPMEAASIASGITADEDVHIAALLHDTVEDANISPDEIRERFGDRVAELVASETESKYHDLPSELTWKQRKTESLRVLQNTDDICVKILWLSDKLANIRAFYRSWLKYGDDAFAAFHQKDKREQAWYYRSIAEAVWVLVDTYAYKEYTRLIDEIFAEVEQ